MKKKIRVGKSTLEIARAYGNKFNNSQSIYIEM